MRRFVFLYLLILSNLVWANNDVETLRKVFVIASEDVNKAKALHAYFEKKEKISGATELAYKGATVALMAKFSSGPHTKLKYVNKALEIINEAVKKEPENFEIRYLRFSVERNLPAILNRSKNIDKDIELIYTYLIKKTLWTDFESDIAKDLIDSNRLSEEKNKQLINQLNKKRDA
ncbi:MAG: hypothetical protein ACK4IK_00825 [Bacteroidia bacterium]